MNDIPYRAKRFIVVVMLLAGGFTVFAIGRNLEANARCFLVLTAMAILAARMKVTLPGFESNISMNLPFILLAISLLPLRHAIAVAAISGFMQTLPRTGQVLKPVQMAFNICHMVNAVAISWMFAARVGGLMQISPMLLIAAGSFAFFLADTVPVAMIVAMTSDSAPGEGWVSLALMTFPYFVLSAGVACIVATGVRVVGWTAGTLLLLTMLGIYHSFQRYFREPARVEAFERAVAAD